MKYRLLFLLCLLGGGLRGQDYLITTRKDTLKGRISIDSYEKMDKLLLMVDKKKSEYPAYSVLGAYLDSVTYVPVRTPDAFRFMRLGHSGMLTLCYARQSPGTPFNIPYLVKRSGESMEVNALRFKKSVSRFLSECSTISQKIEDESLGREDLEKIVDGYNRCLDQQTTVAFVASEDPKLSALSAFNKKMSQDAAVPPDVTEILKDLFVKVKDGKPVPNYLAEGLREALKDFPNYREDVETLLAILNK